MRPYTVPMVPPEPGGEPVSARTTPPFRADHVGSLLRPPELLAGARGPHGRRASTTPALRAAEDEAIRDVVAAAAGRRPASASPTASSAARPGTWTSSTSSTASRRAPERPARSSSTTTEGDIEFTPAAMHVDGKLGARADDLRRRLRFLAARVTTAGAQADDPVARAWSTTAAGAPRSTRPSTPTSTSSGPTSPPPTPRRCAALGELGCTLPAVRRHEPRLPQRPQAARARSRRDRRRRRAPARDLHPPHQRGARRHARRAWRSRRTCAAATSAPPGSAEGGYDFVAEALFNELEVDGFFMEWDDARSGGFEPLRFVPKGKTSCSAW